jgi:hypothetical protein
MKISFSVSEEEFNANDQTIICGGLGIQDQSELPEALQRIAKCAFLEYRKMFTERGLPTKAAEVLQDRLFYLIDSYFQDSLPTEAQISTIFQLTSSGSKTLLKNTMSRYRIHLEAQIRASIKKVLGTKDQDGSTCRFVIQSDTLKNEINQIISRKWPTLKKFLAVQGSAGQYECPIDTYEKLKKEFKISG